MSKYEFANMSTEQKIPWKKKFNIVHETDDSFMLASKEVFVHEEEGLNFKYRYIIEVQDFYDSLTEEELKKMKYNGNVNLYLAVMPESMCESNINKLLEDADLKDPKLLSSFDVIWYGMGVTIGNQQLYLKGGTDWLKHKRLVYVLNSISSVFEAIDHMRGFYLDSPLNLLGTNGWDIIRDCVFGKDHIQATLERYRGE